MKRVVDTLCAYPSICFLSRGESWVRKRNKLRSVSLFFSKKSSTPQ